MTDAQQRVVRRWSEGEISSGKAAEILGMARLEFLEWAGGNNIPYPYTLEMLEDDLKFAKR